MRVPRLIAIGCFITAPLAAQDAVIRGRVTAQNGEPLGGANVIVANTNTGTVTAANGTYTLTVGGAAVRGQQVILTARSRGHKPVTRTITLSAGEQQQYFTLESEPRRVEGVVGTGLAQASDRRTLGYTIRSVSTDQPQAVPASNAPSPAPATAPASPAPATAPPSPAPAAAPPSPAPAAAPPSPAPATGRDSARSTSTEVRSPTSTSTSTSTEVRSPTSTSTSTSTEVRSPTSTSTQAYTAGNFTVTVTGGAGDGANTTVSIGIGTFDPASNETVLRTAGETGINRQQSQQGSQSKSHAEVASVPDDTTVARLLDLPVIHQMTNAAGQPVKLVRDTTGAVIEYTLDNTGKIFDWRVVSQAPGDIPTSPQRLPGPPVPVIEFTLDSTGKVIDWHVVSHAPGVIHTPGVIPTSPQPVGVLGEWVNPLGQTVQRTFYATGNIVERTLDATGRVLNDTTVGRLLDLPVIHQTTNAAGQAVKLAHDTTGAVIEFTLDNTGKIIGSRVVSKAPGASKHRAPAS